LAYEDLSTGTYGEPSSKIYDDWENVHEVTSLPDSAWHRDVDIIVLAAESTGVKTAIVAPPSIYDAGRGPGNTRSVQWNKMASCAMKRGKGFYIGKGENMWTYVNVRDLSALFLSLTEAALAGSQDPNIFGPSGYFYCEAGPYVWKEQAKNIAAAAHKAGFLDTADVDSITKDEAEKLLEGGSSQWGMNSRCKAIRANKVFGWTPKGISPEKALPGIINAEAEALGLVKHHAEVAAGN
jgi:nucleoside-diphosphate-sugar epimerase